MLRDKEQREVDGVMYKEEKVYVPKDDKLRAVTNFIWPYFYQFFDNFHSLKGYEKPSKISFD